MLCQFIIHCAHPLGMVFLRVGGKVQAGCAFAHQLGWYILGWVVKPKLMLCRFVHRTHPLGMDFSRVSGKAQAGCAVVHLLGIWFFLGRLCVWISFVLWWTHYLVWDRCSVVSSSHLSCLRPKCCRYQWRSYYRVAYCHTLLKQCFSASFDCKAVLNFEHLDRFSVKTFSISHYGHMCLTRVRLRYTRSRPAVLLVVYSTTTVL